MACCGGADAYPDCIGGGDCGSEVGAGGGLATACKCVPYVTG